MTKSVTHRQHARNTLVIRPQQDGGAVEDTRDAQPASRSHQERSDRYLAADPRSHAERPGRRVTADASSRRFLAADARRRGPNAASPVDAPLAPGTEAGRPDRDNPPPPQRGQTAPPRVRGDRMLSGWSRHRLSCSSTTRSPGARTRCSRPKGRFAPRTLVSPNASRRGTPRRSRIASAVPISIC